MRMRSPGLTILLIIAAGCAAPPDIEYVETTYPSGAARHAVICALPPGEVPRPAVVFIHGGGWGEGSCDWYRGWVKELARRGYPAFTINYTLGAPDAPVSDMPLKDIAAALDWVRRRRGVRRRAIFLVGESAGGHLALMTALTHGEVAGAVAVSPISDAAALWDEKPYVQNLAYSREESARLSPMAHVHGNAPPVCVIHGCRDAVVPIQQTDRFVAAMLDAGAAVEYHRLYRANHVIFSVRPDIYLPMLEDFIERVVKRGPVEES